MPFFSFWVYSHSSVLTSFFSLCLCFQQSLRWMILFCERTSLLFLKKYILTSFFRVKKRSRKPSSSCLIMYKNTNSSYNIPPGSPAIGSAFTLHSAERTIAPVFVDDPLLFILCASISVTAHSKCSSNGQNRLEWMKTAVRRISSRHSIFPCHKIWTMSGE